MKSERKKTVNKTWVCNQSLLPPKSLTISPYTQPLVFCLFKFDCFPTLSFLGGTLTIQFLAWGRDKFEVTHKNEFVHAQQQRISYFVIQQKLTNFKQLCQRP